MGGKGAYQVLATTRFGVPTTMLEFVRNDENGKLCKNFLNHVHINTDFVFKSETHSTGIALITVANGENTIILDQGANALLRSDIVEHEQELIKNSGMVILLCEIPLDTVITTFKLCTKYNTPVILNSTPATKLSTDHIKFATYVTPNEHEYSVAFGE